MALGSKLNMRPVGCVIKLLVFVLMIVAFMALIYFLFSGLSFFLSGEKIELPAFTEMWSFMGDFYDDFFKGIGDSLDQLNAATEVVE